MPSRLFFTDSDEANELIAKDAMALLIGFALDQQVTVEKAFSGPLNATWREMPDLSVGERLAIAPAIALMFALGLYPQLVLGAINSTALQMVQQLRF